jgi:molecular chaperone GrpE
MTDEPTPDTPTADDAGGTATADETLRERAEKAEEYRLLLKQQQAEFENYQKRAARDRETERRYAQFPLAQSLLPALDNLERALAAARQAGDNSPLTQGVAATHTQLLDILRRHGVSRVEAEGQPFDPNLHQAVMQQPSPDHPPGTVIQVLEPGYLLHERVLRPASVIVSTTPG